MRNAAALPSLRREELFTLMSGRSGMGAYPSRSHVFWPPPIARKDQTPKSGRKTNRRPSKREIATTIVQRSAWKHSAS